MSTVGTVRHAIGELNIRVDIDRDVQVFDRKFLAACDLIAVTFWNDIGRYTLWIEKAKGTFAKFYISLVRSVLASIARPAIVVVRWWNSTIIQVTPIKSTLFFGSAFCFCVVYIWFTAVIEPGLKH